MRRAWLNIAIVLCGAAFVPAALWAQLPKVARQRPGSLNGRVISAKGKPVAGAQIMWQASDGGIPHVLHSDGLGRFHVGRLRTGLYEVRATTSRAWSVWKQNVMVPPGGAAYVTLRLAFIAPSVAAVELNGTMRTWNVPVVGALPHDAAVDPKGNVWFTLQDSGHLARFNPNTHVWKLFKVPTPYSGPHGLVSDASGDIWFTENYVGKIGRLDPRTGAFTEFATHLAKDPHTPVIGPDGAVWFTAENSNVIGRLDVDTGKIAEYGIPTQDSHPYGIVSADDGGLWFCELTGQSLGRVDPSSGVITEFTPSETNVHPRGLVAVNGAIYFTDSGGGRLGRLTLADKKFKFWNSPSGKNSEPSAIAADSTGKIWYVESAVRANKLVRFNPDVEVFTVFPLPAPNSSVRNIARDARGRLWMSLSMPDKIMVVE